MQNRIRSVEESTGTDKADGEHRRKSEVLVKLFLYSVLTGRELLVSLIERVELTKEKIASLNSASINWRRFHRACRYICNREPHLFSQEKTNWKMLQKMVLTT